MKRYVIRRLMMAVPLLLAISFICFLFINLIPSNPAEVDQTERGYEPRAKPRRALFYKVFRGFHHVIIHINMVLFFIIYNFVNDTFKG